MLRLVVIGLIAALLVAIILIGLLALRSLPVPDVLQNLAVGSLTALAGVLAGYKTSPAGDG